MRGFYFINTDNFSAYYFDCVPVDKKKCSGHLAGEEWTVKNLGVVGKIDETLFRCQETARGRLIKLLLTHIFDLQETYRYTKDKPTLALDDSAKLETLKTEIIEHQRLLTQVQADWAEELVDERVRRLTIG